MSLRGTLKCCLLLQCTRSVGEQLQGSVAVTATRSDLSHVLYGHIDIDLNSILIL